MKKEKIKSEIRELVYKKQKERLNSRYGIPILKNKKTKRSENHGN